MSNDQAVAERGLHRIVSFSDGVFAIAITLLVVTIPVPKEPSSELMARIRDLLPEIFSFVLSFLVIAQFWIGHHRIYGLIVRYDSGLLWVNTVHLLLVSFLPFPTAVLGSHNTSTFAVVFYGSALTLASISGFAIWWYAAAKCLLVSDIDAATRHALMIRSIVTPTIFALSAVVGFFSWWGAITGWVLLNTLSRVAIAHRYRRRESGS